MSSKKDGAAIVGAGAAACVVCCAGPILGFLAAIGLGTIAGFVLFGLTGLAAAAIVSVALYRRRQRGATCPPSSPTLRLDPPTVRTSR